MEEITRPFLHKPILHCAALYRSAKGGLKEQTCSQSFQQVWGLHVTESKKPAASVWRGGLVRSDHSQDHTTLVRPGMAMG